MEKLEEAPHPSAPKPIASSLVTLNGPIKLKKFETYVQAKKESQTNSFKADFKVSKTTSTMHICHWVLINNFHVL